MKLSKIERKLDLLAKIDVKLTAVDSKLTSVNSKVDLLAKLHARLDAKLDSIIETQSHINSDLSDRVEGHENRIVALEKRPHA